MTYYELARVLEEITKMLKELPQSTLREIEATEESGVARLTEEAKRVAAELVNIQKEFDKALVAVCDEANKGYARFREVRQKINHDIAALPPLPEVKFPWGIEKIVDFAERSTHLTDAQWQRVIDLARALAVGDGA